MLAVDRHHVANAIRFKLQEADNLWCVIGGQSAWADDNNPPAPSLNTTLIATPIGAKKSTIKWVKIDELGEFAFVGPEGTIRWTEVLTENDVITNGVRWCLLQAEIVGAELPLTDFREVGFFTSLVPASGHENDTELLPADITSYGRLETLEYRKPTSRQASSRYVLSAIIEF